MKRKLLPNLEARSLGARHLFLLATVPLLFGCAQSAQSDPAFMGDSVELGNGEVQTWARLDENGDPIAIGVTMDEGVLDGDALPRGTRQYSLALPEEAGTTLFTHVLFDWNPLGHVPLPIYTWPHFDFHFYMISDRQRMTISDGRVTQETRIDDRYVPPDYKQSGVQVGRMGVHWSDRSAPEWTGERFTETLIYGSSLGKLIFIEPMITKEYLETQPDVVLDIRQPEAVQRSGYYPTAYSIRYDPRQREYTVALEDFVYREGSESSG